VRGLEVADRIAVARTAWSLSTTGASRTPIRGSRIGGLEAVPTPEPGLGGRSPLEHALEQAEHDVLDRLEGVRGLLAQAIEATVDCDTDRASRLTGRAEELARVGDEVHEELMTLIARQAPVAGDLRLAMALVHANDRIARMEAQCVNIATLCNAIPDHEPPSRAQLDCLMAMARLVDVQVAEAAQALRERDVEKVRHVHQQDLEVNDHNRACFDLAVQEGSDELRRRTAFFAALMARALERIGDNAVEIARQASFVVTGQLQVPG
jgi:phosphate transport system protein